MSRKSIGKLILLALISVVGIVITQILWLDKAFDVQESQRELRKQQISAEDKQFNDRLVIALSNVANEILTINNDPTRVFEAVKQVRPNFYTVAINDTVHPYLLERLLTQEFDQRNIREDFEYGIYDCFTDSIVFGNFIPQNSDTVFNAKIEAPDIRWDKDGHYFSVYFPNRKDFTMEEPIQPKVTTWAFSTAIIVIVFAFFSYSMYVILRQKKLSEIKTDFINNMTHELKTPISTISLSSEVLMQPSITTQPERLKQYAQIIHNENQRLKNQVDRVLQLAALDREQIELKKEELDLHPIIRECLDSFRLTVEDRDGKLHTDFSATRDKVRGDRVHITNIIYNLLDNANKYSPENPDISIITRNDRDTFYLSVKDKGMGITKTEQKHIFEKFYRIPTGNVHDVSGFGLGLYYVRMMVEAHKGKISVDSKLNSGSSFTVEFSLI